MEETGVHGDPALPPPICRKSPTNVIT